MQEIEIEIEKKLKFAHLGFRLPGSEFFFFLSLGFAGCGLGLGVEGLGSGLSYLGAHAPVESERF